MQGYKKKGLLLVEAKKLAFFCEIRLILSMFFGKMYHAPLRLFVYYLLLVCTLSLDLLEKEEKRQKQVNEGALKTVLEHKPDVAQK